MAADPNAVEQAVSRTLRDNLEKIQNTANDLHQAVNDLVAACASSRPSNALPPMVRAQISAASLSATLEVLSRFVTAALRPAIRVPFEPEVMHVPSMLGDGAAIAPEQPPPAPSHPIVESSWTAPATIESTPAAREIHPAEVPPNVERPPVVEMPLAAESAPPLQPALGNEPAREAVPLPEPAPMTEPVLMVESHLENEPAEEGPDFHLDSLPPEEQELHRRAYRVAKVSMQDIKLLRPEEVRLGRENKDLCFRLRNEIDNAHKEYDRRFHAIQSHPVDYFYDWMVEILAGGDPQALGEYPFPSPVLRR